MSATRPYRTRLPRWWHRTYISLVLLWGAFCSIWGGLLGFIAAASGVVLGTVWGAAVGMDVARQNGPYAGDDGEPLPCGCVPPCEGHHDED